MDVDPIVEPLTKQQKKAKKLLEATLAAEEVDDEPSPFGDEEPSPFQEEEKELESPFGVEGEVELVEAIATGEDIVAQAAGVPEVKATKVKTKKVKAVVEPIVLAATTAASVDSEAFDGESTDPSDQPARVLT